MLCLNYINLMVQFLLLQIQHFNNLNIMIINHNDNTLTYFALLKFISFCFVIHILVKLEI